MDIVNNDWRENLPSQCRLSLRPLLSRRRGEQFQALRYSSVFTSESGPREGAAKPIHMYVGCEVSLMNTMSYVHWSHL